MGFRAKIFAALALVGLVPTALLGWMSFAVHRSELEGTVGRAQQAVAEEAARTVERFVARGIESLRLSLGVLPVEQLSTRELAAVLRIPYRQLAFLDALVVVDGEGRPLADPVFEPGKGDAVTPADLERLLGSAPLRLAFAAGTAIGVPARGSDGSMRLPLALRLDATRAVLAEMSLGPVRAQLAQMSKDGTLALLASRSGLVLAGASGPLSPDEVALADAAPGFGIVRRADGAYLAAAAPAGALGWTVLVLQRASDAFRPADQVRLYTLFWASVAIALIAAIGFLLARRVTDPIRALSAGVKALAEGRAREPVAVDSGDEIGQFARAFDHMADEIVRRDDEIRRWNAELQARVDQRTAELKAAQDQILRTRRLAALGSLGAGIAHELNNPLTAIGGLVTLLRRDLEGTPHCETLKTIQEQARRVSKIAADLRQFADSERTQAGRRFPLQQSVQAALELYGDQLRSRNIRVEADLRPGVREAQGDPVQIQQVVAHLVQNAISAMPEGGELRVAVSDVDGDALKLTVSDTGHGIPPGLRERIFDPFFTTKDAPGGVGLGLSISHSIVEAHHGRLLVDSAEGRGATFTVVLPAAAAPAHLT